MFNILDLAKLSFNVYAQPRLISTTFSQQIKLRKNFTGIARALDVSPQMLDSNFFYAELYLKFIQGKAIDAAIAFRGTAGKVDAILDSWTWLSDVFANGNQDHLIAYSSYATVFLRQSQNYLQRNFSQLKRLHLTGHSLGGALAKFLVLNQPSAQHATAFNSPGISNIPSINKNRQDLIVNINSFYGIINKIAYPPLGKTFWVHVPQREDDAKQLEQHFDQVRYQQSQLDFRQADHSISFFNRAANNLNGEYERYKTFEQSVTEVSQLPGSVRAEQLCQAIDSNHSLSIKTYFAEFIDYLNAISCEIKVNPATELAAIIAAQHSISNLLNALRSPHYQFLAQQAIL